MHATKTPPALTGVPRDIKVQQRRDELADAALVTLGERGYAGTSLRDIAKNSPLTHGVVHYYFTDKLDLITYAVRRYKEQCATRYDDVVTDSVDAEDLRRGFGQALRRTLAEDTPAHRLWYDLRAQSMFEPGLHETVTLVDTRLEAMIWAVVSRYADLRGCRVLASREATYAAFDGLFERCLVAYHGHDEAAQAKASDLLATEAGSLLELLAH